MSRVLPLQEDKKLSVTYRVESGCLGPEGETLVSDFCRFAQTKLQDQDSDYIIWNVEPREDKMLPEMQYNVVGKTMNHSQAEKYLALFDQSLDQFECHLSDNLTLIINEFMGR